MDTVVSPVFILRQYAWEVLKANTDMVESDYDSNNDGIGVVPIVPLAEEPELTEFDKPYLVYGYALDGTGDLHARKTGSLSFVVYSTRFREITDILTILEEAFGRQDETARDINEWSSSKAPFIGLRFGYVRIGLVEGGTPESPGDRAAETEGGRMSGLINIRFEYYVEYDVKTRLAEFTP